MALRSDYFFEKFTVNGTISEDGKDFTRVRKAFLKRFHYKEEPHDVMREATNAGLDEKDLVLALQRLEDLY